MANPQAEDGHIDIANEIAEHLAYLRLSPNETQIIWALLRKTWGWHKKSDKISLTQWSSLTGIATCNVSRAIKLLEKRHIITANRKSYITEYMLQKDYDLWDYNIKPVSGQPVSGQTVSGQPVSGQPVSGQPVSALITNSISTDSTPTPEGSISTDSNKRNIKETIQKKHDGNLENYKKELIKEFNDIDFEEEIKKFELYWSEDHRQLKKPRLALRNWMLNARKFKKDGNNNGHNTHYQNNYSRRLPTGDELEAQGKKIIEEGVM
jgi:phage replication O-like protein O